MKKLAVLLGAIAITSASYAQKATTDAPMSLEGQIGYNASTLSWSAPSIRFRYFVSDNIAGRLTLGIQNSSETINHTENADGTGAVGTEVNKTSMFMVGIGGEYHFAGTDRLSPYGGLDIQFGTGNATAEWDMYDGASYNPDVTASVDAPESMFGVNLVAGTDYYFAENFYLGLELGLGLQSYTQKEGTTEVTVAGTTTTSTTPEYKSSTFGNNFISQFRLGWRF